MRISAIISRFGISLLAHIVFCALICCFYVFIAKMNNLSIFIIFLYVSIYVGWKALLILPVISYVIDEFILIKLKHSLNMPYKVYFIIGLIIYPFLGRFLIEVLYGKNPFFVFSGITVAVIYYLLCQAAHGIALYQKKKLANIQNTGELEQG
jgi:hypothetical protein